MDADLVRQRIKYLVEYGGVLDDPLADIRRGVKLAVRLAAVACAIASIELALAAVLHWYT